MKILFLLFCLSVISQQVHFSDYKVLRCNQVPNVPFGFFDRFDVWRRDATKIDIFVKNNEQYKLLNESGFHCEEWIKDLNSLPLKKRQVTTNLSDDMYFKQYNDYEVMLNKLQEWSSRSEGVAKFVPSIGSTIEGRAIPAMHLTVPNGFSKKRICAVCGLHAREWISPQTCMFLIYSLLNNTDLLTSVEFVIFPIINPDGYMFSRTTDRYWRKNRRDNGNGIFGVDLNRNFDFLWGQSGSSNSPDAEDYRGLSAASEPETQALQSYVKNLGISHLGFDIHSYGQYILRPYGYTKKELHPTEASNKILGDGMTLALKNVHGSEYMSTVGAEVFRHSGCLDDWFTSKGMIGFTIELRDKGKYGFLLPEDQIIPTGQEIFEAMKYAVHFLSNQTII
jgi:hypothetical protein